MNGYQKLKRQLLPLIKGSPIIVGCFIIGLFIARTIVKYTPNEYQTIARIKLDDQKFGVSNNYMYKDFEMFSAENKIEAEAELLKSPLIIGIALDSMNLDVQFSRIGTLRDVELYDDNPFYATYDITDENFADQTILLTVKNARTFSLARPEEAPFAHGRFGQKIVTKGGNLFIYRNERAIREKQLDVEGSYQIRLYSRDALINDITSRLDITAFDKETPILRIVYKDKNPRKAADFTNNLCNAYINDYVQTKSSAARQTVNFIDSQLKIVTKDLGSSENSLENFKLNNDVVNTLQETETGLREISKLKVELINLEMNENALRELESYIASGDYFDETAINFGFGDLLMTELVKKLKVLYDEKHDMLLKYTANSEPVQVLDRKIAEIKRYIKEAIKRNLKEITIKRRDYERVVEQESHMFDYLPTREKNQHILEREFQINEDVYNFLMQKKIDASILACSLISFHRIIQPATIPTEPVSPNKTLLSFVFGLFGLIIGISFVYFRQFTRARVLNRDDVEKHTTIPFLGIIRRDDKEEDFSRLFRAIQLRHKKEKLCISINSSLSGEGKTFITTHLANACERLGMRVCCLHYFTPDSHRYPLLNNPEKPVKGVREYAIDQLSQSTLEQLQLQFDLLLIDTPATANEIAGIEAMQVADITLFVVRANHTCLNYLTEPGLIQQEYNIETMYMVLNNAHKGTNYTGSYVGSRFDYKKLQRRGILARVQQIYQLYFR